MRAFDWIARWLRSRGQAPNQPSGPITFATVRRVEESPSNDTVHIGDFYVVMRSGDPRWALFRCPCGCNDVVTLSLQKRHRPFWRLAVGSKGRPFLAPSVWRNVGCGSHFWIQDGVVVWALDEEVPRESPPRR